MKKHRENLLNRDNQQERLDDRGKVSKVTHLSSETTCCESQTCTECKKQVLTMLNHSSTKKYRSQTKCDCCGDKFSTKNKLCLHHVGKKILGVVCNRCNQVLGDESEERRIQLLCCKLWIEDTQQWDHDIVRSAWRHAEAGRND